METLFVKWPTIVEFQSENGSVCQLQDWGRELVVVTGEGGSLTPGDVKRLLPALQEFAETGLLPKEKL